MCGEGRQDTVHGPLDRTVAFQAVGYIDKRNIDTHALWERVCMAVETICLSHTPAHSHAIDGMPQAFLRYGYQKCHRRIGRASCVSAGNHSKRKGQGAEFRSTRAEQLFYRNEGAEFVFLPEAIPFHGLKNQAFVRAR